MNKKRTRNRQDKKIYHKLAPNIKLFMQRVISTKSESKPDARAKPVSSDDRSEPNILAYTCALSQNGDNNPANPEAT